MAKSFAPPEGCDYEFPKDWNNWREHDEKYKMRLRRFCKENTDSKSNLVGETVNFPIADGYAQYMVFRTKPLQLIHIPVGDAWQADACTIRGLRLKDVKEMVKREKALDSIFN